ncbi:MAG: hypothetical protein LBG81_04995, partial [Coriobacteriaceae bacterium]|nr:hypothetical protein [Coriobacteriaceae bacterium]
VSRETFVREFSYKGYHDLRIQLLGSYQPFNAALAIEAIDALRDRGWQISEEAMRRGLMNTRWPGRFEVVAQAPTFIIDGSHNPQGAQTLLESLQSNFPDQRPVFIVGVLKDKDYQALLEPLVPWGAAFVVVEPPTKRALPVSDLARAIHSQAPQARLHEAHGFPEAVAQACELAGKEGLVCAFGSLYSIASLKAAVAAQTQPVA